MNKSHAYATVSADVKSILEEYRELLSKKQKEYLEVSPGDVKETSLKIQLDALAENERKLLITYESIGLIISGYVNRGLRGAIVSIGENYEPDGEDIR